MEKKNPIYLHKKYNGKIEIQSIVKISSKKDLSWTYTPGVAEVVKEINKDPKLSFETTFRGRSVAIISNSTRVLGLGKVKVEAGLPVMEGKALLMKEFGGIDAFPLCVKADSLEELSSIIESIQYSFGAINLEDISSPMVFELYDKLEKHLSIPVFHDDRHGTGIVVLAALINSLKLVKKENPRIVVVGLGSAGYGIIELLHYYGFRDIIAIDSRGVLCKDRIGVMGTYKERIVEMLKGVCISRADAFKDADVVIAASSQGSINEDDLKLIAKDGIIFTLSNPIPEIDPKISKKYAKIVATGRSDLPNQVNNLLAFPGLFKGILKARAKKINKELMIEAAKAISESVKPDFNSIVPSPLRRDVHRKVSEAVYIKAKELGL